METKLKNTSSLDDTHFKSSILIRSDIAKSQEDSREYRGLKLANGLKVLLISDPTTDVSTAALSVEIGHMSDPEELHGLAHFCEHMIFLGTKKYPEENAFSNFLAQNKGNSNAETHSNMTKYYFDIAPDKLEPALDIFAQFFIAPLFSESGVEREINAVNSEHEKNLASDVWRIRHVHKHLADPSHPFYKFGPGNKTTLYEIPKTRNINVPEELKNFFKKWYSANIMSLAVFGKESLDELEEMIVAKFIDIENKKIDLPVWSPNVYKKDQYETKVFITPIKDQKSLTISFSTEDISKYYKATPEQYLSHLIGHEGKGSILSHLREKGWSNDLLAGHNNTPRGFGFFEITVDLTKEGFLNIDKIILTVFQYIKMLKEEGLQKWIFEENQNINEMLFRFKDKENPLTLVTNVVHCMQMYPLNEVLTAPYLNTEWREDLIKNLLEYLVPENCRITIVGESIEPILQNIEPWYNTKFHTEKISSDTIMEWKNCVRNESLKLPEPNPFIPTNFSLYPADPDLAKHPIIIYDSSILRVWHKQDTEFLKPKTYMNFDFSNPIIYSDPLNCNLSYMLVMMFRDHLNEYLYNADLAGLKFAVANTTSGISIAINGYTHKQETLLKKVIDDFFNLKYEQKRFDILKDEYNRLLSNFKAEQPFQHAIYYLALILTDNAWSKAELLDAMQLVTFDRLCTFTQELLSRLHAECFIYGNINKQKTWDVVDIVKSKLEKTNSVILPLLARQFGQKREYKLPDGDSYLFETTNDYHTSSCAEIYIQCGPQTDNTIILTDLIVQILSEPCYDTLRTKEQLGYIVFCGSRKVYGVIGIRIIVQSLYSPMYIEKRIEVFLHSMMDKLVQMKTDEFNRYKDALILQKLEKPKKLSAQFNRYLTEIALCQYHFERCEVEAALLRKVTQADVINFYKTYVLQGSPKRRLLSIHIISNIKKEDKSEECNFEHLNNQETNDDVLTPNNHIRVDDLFIFKSTKELYPVVRPVLDIIPKGGRSKL